MAERKITFVDTTMRDGSHAVRHSFTKEQVSQIAARLDKCGVPPGIDEDTNEEEYSMLWKDIKTEVL